VTFDDKPFDGTHLGSEPSDAKGDITFRIIFIAFGMGYLEC